MLNNIVLSPVLGATGFAFVIFGSGYFPLRNADAFKFGFKRLSVETIYSLTERDKIRNETRGSREGTLPHSFFFY